MFCALLVVHASTAPTNLETDLFSGTSELLTPPANVSIKHVTIGHGIQNFTCASLNATPVAIGALANLYDATTLAFSNETALATAPSAAVYLPLVLSSNSSLVIPGLGTFPHIGQHFFSAAEVPTFVFATLGEMLSGKTLATINAPAGSNPGPAGTGATTWLDLGDKGGSTGLSGVYRVLTAGGLPYKTCQGQNESFSIPYAATYWFVDLTNTTASTQSTQSTGSPAISSSATSTPTIAANASPRSYAPRTALIVLIIGGLSVFMM
jgi:hypothetical protein